MNLSMLFVSCDSLSAKMSLELRVLGEPEKVSLSLE